MQWLEIIIHTGTEAQDIISDMLIEKGITGTSILDKAYIPDINKPGIHWELYDKSLLDSMPEDVEVHAWLKMDNNLQKILSDIQIALDEIKNANYSFPLGTLKLDSISVDDKDWKDVWKQYYKPLRIGKNIIVKPSWEQYNKQEKDIIIELDPGMAFGTGSHATTHMCLELLEKYIVESSTVVDIGTGSGILAIASALLGAKNILAVDINVDAVEVAKENIEKNALTDKISVMQGDLLKSINLKCDIAVANIIADAIIMLTPDVTKILNTNGIYIVSGILSERAEEIINNVENQGFKLVDKLCLDEWVGLAFELKD